MIRHDGIKKSPRRATLAITIALVIAGAASSADAAVIQLSLSSSDDLSSLTVGGPAATIDVTLSGLGDELDDPSMLDFLSATLGFDGSLLQAANATPGPIVPDATGFGSAFGVGTVSGDYDSLFATGPGGPIATNGIFFSFTVQALMAGRGEIMFDFVDGFGDGAVTIETGGPLAFTVLDADQAVPEPCSLVLLALGGVGLARCGVRRHRKQAS